MGRCILKYDGYRLLARIEGNDVRCFTRNGHDWSDKLPELVKALHALKLRSAWIDGEIVVDGENGAPDFQALQNAFERSSTTKIVYWMFDLPFFDGHDLREIPFEERSCGGASASSRPRSSTVRSSNGISRKSCPSKNGRSNIQ